jgi:hypothetical protein
MFYSRKQKISDLRDFFFMTLNAIKEKESLDEGERVVIEDILTSIKKEIING